jgi:hypothetical protein
MPEKPTKSIRILIFAIKHNPEISAFSRKSLVEPETENGENLLWGPLQQPWLLRHELHDHE